MSYTNYLADKPWIPYRYKITLMTAVGFCSAITIRSTFNIALVAMVNFTAVDQINITSDECPGDSDTTNKSTDSSNVSFALIYCLYLLIHVLDSTLVNRINHTYYINPVARTLIS